MGSYWKILWHIDFIRLLTQKYYLPLPGQVLQNNLYNLHFHFISLFISPENILHIGGQVDLMADENFLFLPIQIHRPYQILKV